MSTSTSLRLCTRAPRTEMWLGDEVMSSSGRAGAWVRAVGQRSRVGDQDGAVLGAGAGFMHGRKTGYLSRDACSAAEERVVEPVERSSGRAHRAALTRRR